MRQGQQNRRGRGRTNNSNRGKGHHNPLSRSFKSNGPDVKIRGTPAHIAEKYLSLARDAQSTGDPVLAENHLQHAEHYNRIIMAYRDQFNQPNDGMNGGGQRMRGPGDIAEGFDDGGDDDMAGDDGFPQPFSQAPQGHQSQPRRRRRASPAASRDARRQRARTPGSWEPRGERPERSEQRSDRPERQERPFRRDRDQRPPRFGDRGDRGERQGFIDRDRQAESSGRAKQRAAGRDARARP